MQRLGDKEGSICRKLQSTSVLPQLKRTDGEGAVAVLSMPRHKA